MMGWETLYTGQPTALAVLLACISFCGDASSERNGLALACVVKQMRSNNINGLLRSALEGHIGALKYLLCK